MEEQSISQWEWQKKRLYIQAVEAKNVENTLYVSGQTAISADGISSTADLRTQLLLAIQNLEHFVERAGYLCSNSVRLNIDTTSTEELWPHFKGRRPFIQ